MCCALVYCLVVDLTISVLVSVGLLFHDVELDVGVKVLPWVVVGAGGLGAGKTSGAGTRGVSLDVVIGGRTGHSDTNGGESSDNRSKIHADCGPAENPSL